MKQQRAIRVGVTMILLAAVWRLVAGCDGQPLKNLFQNPEVAAFLITMETGRVVRLGTLTPPDTAPTVPEQPQTQPDKPEVLCFSAEDAALLELRNYSSFHVDKASLLHRSLDWDLQQQSPAVLILHTHTTESYTKTGQDYEETAAYRTLNTDYNMVQVGERLAQQLQAIGIGVIHDTTIHDYPSYTGSYDNSRKTVKAYMQKYPSLCLVLDIHRDAAEYDNGSQMETAAVVDGVDTAQLMLVVGSSGTGRDHPNWQENLALASKLQVTLEKRWPGIVRPICLRSERFNQDLMPGALLVEVGAAGNTLEEALAAADCLAWAIGQLAAGANQTG